MKFIRALIARFTGLFPNDRREREIVDELEAHLQMHIDDNLRAGMTLQQARREAMLKLGGVESTKQVYREQNTLPILENLIQDIRFAIRQLRKNPGFTSVAIGMLALGMCASVAIFAFVEAALIKPLPYPNPGRLVGVFETIALFPQSDLSYADYLDWKKLNTVFSSLDVYQRNGFMLTTPAGVQPARGARVSDGFFRTLGIKPVLGRDFYTGEDLPAAKRALLLSYAAWQTRYGGRADVIGKVVILDDAPNIIIGVLPRGFHFAPAEPAEFWTALHPENSCETSRSCHDLYGVARLKDGVPLEAALANVRLIAQQLEKQYPDSNRGQGGTVAPLVQVIVGNIRPILLLLLSGAGLLLFIASVNVASLLLVRSESRKREIAVRTSLGASRVRILRQFATEGLLLVLIGSALGVTSASWVMRPLASLIPANMFAQMPFLHDLGLNRDVLLFAGGISVLAAILFSLTPVWQLSSRETRAGLTEGSRGSAGHTWRRLGSKLVVVELATAMVLLVGAGLLGKSLYRLLRVDVGMRPDHLVTLRVSAPEVKSRTQAIALERLVLNRIERLPGVRTASICRQGLPLDGKLITTWFRVLGRPWHGEHHEAPQHTVSAGYFQVLEAKLVRGRYFKEDEDASKPRVAIVNAAMAKQYFPGEDAIGKQFSYLSNPPQPITIIGIVEDIKEGSLDVPTPPILYFPFNQEPSSDFGIILRTSQDEHSLLPALAAGIHGIDPGIVTYDGATMMERIHDSPSAYLHRSSAWLVGGFAVLALLLSVVGLYGVVAYSVSQRTSEIGVRMALGAQPGSVYSLVLKEAGWLTAIGAFIGLTCSVAGATLIQGFLFEVRSWDIPTLAAVAVVLGISALLASFLPARRAASVNPIEALRSE